MRKNYTTSTRESTIELHLHKEIVRNRGGYCIKLNPAWNIGVPDRLIVLPGFIGFIELKRPSGGRLSKMQKRWKDVLHRMQIPHYTLCNHNEVDTLLKRIDSGCISCKLREKENVDG